MKLIDKYIFKQVLMATLMGILIFLIVWISPEILFRIIKQTILGEISSKVAVQLFFLEMPEILGKAIPVGLLLGCLFVFDSFSNHFELTIFRGIGVSIKRLLLPVVLISIIGSALCFFTYENFIPYSTQKIKELKNELANEQFVYIDKDRAGKPLQIVIVEYFNGKEMHHVKVMKFSDNVNESRPMIENIRISPRAKFDDGNWTLPSGKIYDIGADGVYKTVRPFYNAEILTGTKGAKAYELLEYSTKRPREMKIDTIKHYMNLLKSEDLMDEYRYLKNKYFQRYAQSISCIFLAICGVILGISKPRQKRYVGYTLAVAIIFGYYITVPFFDLVAQNGILPPYITAWLPSCIIVGASFFMAKHKEL